MRHILKWLVPWLKNKYVLTIFLFLVWMTFFDRNDLITQYNQRSALNQIKQDKAYYLLEIQKNREMIEGLTTNSEQLERFAREKYLMKKDNEDVFVIVEKQD